MPSTPTLASLSRGSVVALVVAAVVLHTVLLGALGAAGWALTGLVLSAAKGPVAPSGAGDALGGPAADGELVAAQFEQTVTYDDGLQLSLTAPRPFEPSPEARGGGLAEAVVITITLHNGGDTEVPLRAASAVTSGGSSAEVVVDPANGLTGVPPVGSIAPGQTVSYDEGYSVTDASDVVVLLEPSSDYLPARFTG